MPAKVTLSAEVAAAMRPHLDDKDAKAFVFTTRQGGWWRHGAFYGRRWQPPSTPPTHVT